MKKWTSILLLILLCFCMLSNCEKEGAVDDRITFDINSFSNETHEIVITVHNGSETDIFFTRNYTIQMKAQGKWIVIEPPKDTDILTDILQCPKNSNSTYSLYWPYSISPGNEYRMIKQYAINEWSNEGQKNSMYCEFNY